MKRIKGILTTTLRDAETGEIVFQEKGKANTFVENGMDMVGAFMLAGEADSYVRAMALGTSNAAAASDQTALSSEILEAGGRSGIQATNSTAAGSIGFTVSWQTDQLTAHTIGEVGLFNTAAITAGSMYARYAFASTFSKDNTQTLTVEYTVGMG